MGELLAVAAAAAPARRPLMQPRSAFVVAWPAAASKGLHAAEATGAPAFLSIRISHRIRRSAKPRACPRDPVPGATGAGRAKMLELGGLLISGSVLLLAVLGPVFRHPNPPRWTTWPFVGEFTSIGIVSTLAFGIAFFVTGVMDFIQNGVNFVHIALLLVVLVAVIFFGRWIIARALPKASAS
jgi:hypothetical protein